MRGLSLWSRFALLTLVAVAAVGVLLVNAAGVATRRLATSNEITSAESLGRLAIGPHLGEYDLEHGLTRRDEMALAEVVVASHAGGTRTFLAVRAWNRHGTIMWSDDRSVIGTHPDQPGAVGEALRDDRTVTFVTSGGVLNPPVPGRVLLVATPVRAAGHDEPAGVIEVWYSYAEVDRAVSQAERSVAMYVAGLLVLLYLMLFPIVLGASRRLREESAENHYLALHDPLTRLPNRTLFNDRLAQAVTLRRREGGHAATLLVDLDRFKPVNDQYGHQVGDHLLVEVAARIRELLRASDTVARFGGDEFVILLPVVDSAAGALTAATKLEAALTRPFVVDDHELSIGASIGVALFPDDGTCVDELLRQADIAMYQAKQSGGGTRFAAHPEIPVEVGTP